MPSEPSTPRSSRETFGDAVGELKAALYAALEAAVNRIGPLNILFVATFLAGVLVGVVIS